VDRLLLFNGRVFLPDESSLWPQVLEQAHTIGHEGSEKTLHWFRAAFYSPSTHQRVSEFIRGCLVCQRIKTEHLHSAGLLQPLPVPIKYGATLPLISLRGFQ
jgi:hypothetical protein